MVDGIGERAFTLRLVACLCVLAAGPARAFDEANADRALQFAQQQLNRTASNPRLVPPQSPKASTDGTWTLVSNTDKIGWTQGDGVGFHPNQQNPRGAEVDKSLIYSDYFFVEALTRFKLASAGGWYSTLDFPRSLHDLGTHNTGVQVVEFDVTPLSKPIDAVIGYADTSTNVTSYASLALAVRLNPRGFFDVRRGGEYAALINLAYEAYSTYHVRIRANMNARTYSVWVTPQGGGEVQLADHFAFRSDAPPTNDLGKLSLKSGHFDNEILVTDHTVRAETAASPAPDSPAEQPEPTGETTLEDDGQSGCAAASGSTMAVAGLLLWLLGISRRPRAPRRQR